MAKKWSHETTEKYFERHLFELHMSKISAQMVQLVKSLMFFFSIGFKSTALKPLKVVKPFFDTLLVLEEIWQVSLSSRVRFLR